MKRKLSLANKYRPKNFEDLSEQTSIKTILENQIKTNNLKHVYLFCGGAGTGKTTSARIIANMINNNIGSPFEMDCASHNGVEDARKIIDDCRTRPIGVKYKIYILDECHMLSMQAWNSLLKLFEEPPEFVIIIMCTTDPQKIPSTILSRIQRFNFSRISTEGIIKRLKYIIDNENNDFMKATDLTSEELEYRNKLINENKKYIEYDDSAISYIARLAKGGMRDSITTLEKCLDYNTTLNLNNVYIATSGGITEDSLLTFLKLTLDCNAKEALIHFNNIYMSGIDISIFIRLYIEFLENCIKYILTQDSNIVSISDITIKWLTQNSNFMQEMKAQLLDALKIKSDYSPEDLKIIIESWIIQICNS